MFPLGFSGDIALAPIHPPEVDTVLDGVVQKLSEAKALDISRCGNGVTFRAGMFRLVSNWNPLVAVTSGSIEVVPGEPGVVKYDFSCLQLLIVVTVMSAWLGLGTLSSVRTNPGILIVPVIAWGWLFGMNYLVAMFRVRAFVREAATVNPWGPSSRACSSCGRRYYVTDYDPGAPEWRCSGCDSVLDRDR